jgi:hypothetical protein
MKTITFDNEKSAAIESAVCNEMNCSIYSLNGGDNTMSKKVVVFLSSKLLDYNRRLIARKYQITYLYVPTVVEDMQWKYKVDLVFRNTINNILKKTGYAEILDIG